MTPLTVFFSLPYTYCIHSIFEHKARTYRGSIYGNHCYCNQCSINLLSAVLFISCNHHSGSSPANLLALGHILTLHQTRTWPNVIPPVFFQRSPLGLQEWKIGPSEIWAILELLGH
ncbi:hypothetical protein B0H19DRAFT_557183 [Mycena capillaripes]|nr:hypothetical protein B0H19DRAFT_557183 [Mycena capillaripes]